MKTEIKEFLPIKVAALRHVGPVESCTPTWNELYDKTGTSGDTTQAIGIMHDDPRLVDQSKLRYDACVTVPNSFEAKEPVEVKTIDGGEYLVAVHKGSFSGLSEFYKEIYENQLPALGRKAAGSPLQVYINNPKNVTEKDQLTEIRVPLE